MPPIGLVGSQWTGNVCDVLPMPPVGFTGSQSTASKVFCFFLPSLPSGVCFLFLLNLCDQLSVEFVGSISVFYFLNCVSALLGAVLSVPICSCLFNLYSTMTIYRHKRQVLSIPVLYPYKNCPFSSLHWWGVKCVGVGGISSTGDNDIHSLKSELPGAHNESITQKFPFRFVNMAPLQ